MNINDVSRISLTKLGRNSKLEGNSYIRKGENVLKRPCIAVDVSKGKSHYQGWINCDKKLGKAREISHNLEGFKELLDKYNELKTETKMEPVVVFEATGIYHSSLKQFLESNSIEFIIISPLASAKVRKSNIRATKTDKRDCKNIAYAYFIKDFKTYSKQDEIYDNMHEINRYYHYLTEQLRKIKIQFRMILDVIYPNLDKLVNEKTYTPTLLELLKKYNHPDLIKGKKPESIAKYLEKHTTHKYEFCYEKAKEFINYSKVCVSGCKKDNIMCLMLIDVINQIEEKNQERELYLNTLVDLAEGLTNYDLLLSIPGISSNLAARILAELGDIERFPNHKCLTAFCGLDPTIYQSGQMSGEHLQITKKGNKELRCLLYLACGITIQKDNKIHDYYNKKIADGLCRKSARIACMNKLSRVIYSMCKTGCLFNNQ